MTPAVRTDCPTQPPGAMPLALERVGDDCCATTPLSGDAITLGGGPRCDLRVSGAKPLGCVVTLGLEGPKARRWSDGVLLNGEPFSEALLKTGDMLTIDTVDFRLVEFGAHAELPNVENHLASEAVLTSPKQPKAEERWDNNLGDILERVTGCLAEEAPWQFESPVHLGNKQSPTTDTPNIPAHGSKVQRERLASARLRVSQLANALRDVRKQLSSALQVAYEVTAERDASLVINRSALAEVDELANRLELIQNERDNAWQVASNAESQIVLLEAQIAQLENERDLLSLIPSDTPKATEVDDSWLKETNTYNPLGEGASYDEFVYEKSAIQEATADKTTDDEIVTDDASQDAPSIEVQSKEDDLSEDFHKLALSQVEVDETLETAEDYLFEEDNRTEEVAGLQETFESPSDSYQDSLVDEIPSENAPAENWPIEDESAQSDASEPFEDRHEEPADEWPEVELNEIASDQDPTPALLSAFEPKPHDPAPSEPVSFIEKYAHTLDEDESHEPIDNNLIDAVEPAPVTQPELPINAESDTEEESVDDYMLKMMERLRNDDAPSIPVVQEVVKTDDQSNDATTVNEDAPSEPEPLLSLEDLVRSEIPERDTDMDALRKLANTSAQHAIQIASLKARQEQLIVRGAVATIATGFGAFAMFISETPSDLSFIAGSAGILGGAYIGSRALAGFFVKSAHKPTR